MTCLFCLSLNLNVVAAERDMNILLQLFILAGSAESLEVNDSILSDARRWSFRSLSHLWAFRRMLPYLIRGIKV